MSIHYGMPAAQYHGDADGPRLSQSLATVCVNQSPMHAHQLHPLLGAKPWEYEPSTDDGTLIHALILEPETALIHPVSSVYDAKHERAGELVTDFKTKAAREERDMALARGCIPVLQEKLGVYQYKAKAIRSRLQDEGEELEGSTEVVIYWTEETPFGPVRCRARIDHLRIEDYAIKVRDLKSCASAHPRKLQGSCYDYGYDIQEAAYRRAVEAAWPEYKGRVDVGFWFAELDKPYAVNVQSLNAEFKAMGEMRWDKGRNLWAENMGRARWQGYAKGELAPPGYALSRELDL